MHAIQTFGRYWCLYYSDVYQGSMVYCICCCTSHCVLGFSIFVSFLFFFVDFYDVRSGTEINYICTFSIFSNDAYSRSINESDSQSTDVRYVLHVAPSQARSRIKRTKLIVDNYNSLMSFHPEAQESDTAIFLSDAKGEVEGKLETNVDNNRTKNPDSETLDVEETVRQIGEMTSSTGATTRAENDQQPIQLVQTRPSHNTARNRMYSSQNSFNSLDFDYYDIHDCSMYKNNTGSSTNDEQNGTAGDGAMVTNAGGSTKVIVKSSSSINIAGEVQSLFNPPISSSALNPQQCVPLSSQEQSHSLFRSTSSESISLKQRYQTTLQQKPYEKIRLGICAMDKKAQSQPMKEILSRLDPKGMVAFICVCLTLIASNI